MVVNTCSVTATADQGARQTIRRIARDNPAARIVVTGCYATRRPDEVGDLPNVVRVVPNDDKPRLIPLIAADFGLTTAERFRRWRRQLRRGDRAGRRRPDRVHAARADRLRRAVLVLHHSDDARPAAKRGDRDRAGARSIGWPPPGSRRSR